MFYNGNVILKISVFVQAPPRDGFVLGFVHLGCLLLFLLQLEFDPNASGTVLSSQQQYFSIFHFACALYSFGFWW